jgi:F0F1-type ATP synthase beta subunit
VGRATLGRIINVIGEAIDERGDISKLSACIVLHKTSNWFFFTDTLQ